MRSLRSVSTIGKVERFLDAKRVATMKPKCNWQELYEAALLETNCEKLQPCIRAAKAAIEVRLQELQLGHGGALEERQAISDAVRFFFAFLGVNEFYQKGCQEKSSATTGDEMFSRDPAHWDEASLEKFDVCPF